MMPGWICMSVRAYMRAIWLQQVMQTAEFRRRTSHRHCMSYLMTFKAYGVQTVLEICTQRQSHMLSHSQLHRLRDFWTLQAKMSVQMKKSVCLSDCACPGEHLQQDDAFCVALHDRRLSRQQACCFMCIYTQIYACIWYGECWQKHRYFASSFEEKRSCGGNKICDLSSSPSKALPATVSRKRMRRSHLRSVMLSKS